MSRKVNFEYDLIKEAYDVIQSLKDEVVTLTSELEKTSSELQKHKDSEERNKIASILEERDLVPYEKIVDLREGRLSQSDFESLKNVANAHVDYISSTLSHSKEASLDSYEGLEEATVSRQEMRARMFKESLENLKK